MTVGSGSKIKYNGKFCSLAGFAAYINAAFVIQYNVMGIGEAKPVAFGLSGKVRFK